MDVFLRWARGEHGPVIMVRPGTRPDDVLAAQGVVTRGGRVNERVLAARPEVMIPLIAHVNEP